MVTPNRRHLIKDEFFSKEYSDLTIPVHEQDLFHVIMESRVFHRTQGNKLSKSMVQSFAPNMWDFVLNKSQYLSGYTTFIVHDPTIAPADQSQSTEGGKESAQTEPFKLIEVDRVGKVTIAKLKKAGIESVEELAELSRYSEEEILPLAQAAGIELAQLYEYAASAKELIEKG